MIIIIIALNRKNCFSIPGEKDKTMLLQGVKNNGSCHSRTRKYNPKE